MVPCPRHSLVLSFFVLNCQKKREKSNLPGIIMSRGTYLHSNSNRRVKMKEKLLNLINQGERREVELKLAQDELPGHIFQHIS